jgi:glycerol uptake facilitator-like aquaporin
MSHSFPTRRSSDLFIVAPLVGAVIAWAIWKFIRVDAVKS